MRARELPRFREPALLTPSGTTKGAATRTRLEQNGGRRFDFVAFAFGHDSVVVDDTVAGKVVDRGRAESCTVSVMAFQKNTLSSLRSWGGTVERCNPCRALHCVLYPVFELSNALASMDYDWLADGSFIGSADSRAPFFETLRRGRGH